MSELFGKTFDRFRKPSAVAESQGNNQIVLYDGDQQLTQSAPKPVTFQCGLQVLHDCPDAEVDICFVHGLTGNMYNTWKAAGQSKTWPEALLAPELKAARILTFGYDAYIVGKKVASTNGLIDHADSLITDLTHKRARTGASDRALIFVAHSLGGLVCKRALLQSRNHPDTHYRGVFQCTKGIIFMGTPHSGSWMAKWAGIPAKFVGAVVKSTNTKLLDVLGTSHQLLESTQIEFLSMIRDLGERKQHDRNGPIEVTCFYEELPFPLVGSQVVTKDSATFSAYKSISIHANHSDMVKFASSDDPGFVRVLGELIIWEKEIEEEVARKAAEQELQRQQKQDEQRRQADDAQEERVNPRNGGSSYNFYGGNNNTGGGKQYNGGIIKGMYINQR